VSWARPASVAERKPDDRAASPTTAMTHIAIAEALDGTVVEWMDKVSDDEYGR